MSTHAPNIVKLPKQGAGIEKATTIQRLRTATRLPRGPRMYTQPTTFTGGPGKPPPGFVVGQTSASEWNLYWAFAKVFGEPVDPRKPPFQGGFPYWGYQVSYMGAYRRAPGSAVVDYVIYNGASRIGVRLQTLRFHSMADAQKKAFDSLQKFDLDQYASIVDIFEEEVLGDPSGAKYVVAAKNAIGMLEHADPILAGLDPRRKWSV